MKKLDMAAVRKIIEDVAASEIMPRFRRLGQGDIESKGEGDPVTVADKAAEDALVSRLGDLLPGSAFVGEEGCFKNPNSVALLEGSGDVWVIDPIDGTRNFIEGRKEFGVMVALVRGRQTIASWIHDPNTGHTLEAEKGGGVWLGGGKMRLSGREGVVPRLGIVGSRIRSVFEKPKVAAVVAALPALAVGSSVAFDYARFFVGSTLFANSCAPRASFSIYRRSKSWDHMPGLFLLSEAGGYAAAFNGSPYSAQHECRGLLVASDLDDWMALRGVLEPMMQDFAVD